MKTRIASKDDLAVSVNIPDRHLAVITGSLLILNAFRRKQFSYLQAIVGSVLLYRGISRQRFLGNAESAPEKTKPASSPPLATIGSDTQEGSFEIKATVKKPASIVYQFFKSMAIHAPFEKLSKQAGFWRFKLGEKEFYFQATLLEDKKDQILSWQSIDAGNLSNAGIIVFTAQEQQTLLEFYFTFSATHAPADLESKLKAFLQSEIDLVVEKLNKA